MSLIWVLEAAGRSLIMGMIIWLALRLLRVRQVRAQRAAWLVALAGALLMPVLAGCQIGLELLPAVVTIPPAVRMPAQATDVVPQAVPVIAYFAALYGTVSAVLLIRLALGLATALRIRNRATVIEPGVAPGFDVRVTGRVAAPATIRSSILLPPSYREWSQERLRIVLSHESAHVRQRDFDVQLLAGLHCALFWFSPFSWWLRRQLADLGEALSDHAAVQCADSRASYAEVLLSFAGSFPSENPVPSAAVAMARSSNLSARIERLLGEGFHQCFANKPRALLAAALIAAVALAASTVVTRAQAAATHGFVHSDEMYSGEDIGAALPPGVGKAAAVMSLSVDVPPAPAMPELPKLQYPPPPAVPAAPPAPPAPAAPAPHLEAHQEAIDAYAREMVRAQRELTREAERLAREQTSTELRAHRAEIGAELARAHEHMAEAERQLSLQLQSPQMKALREQQSELSRQMTRLAEQQVRLIEQAMKAFNAAFEKATREELATPGR